MATTGNFPLSLSGRILGNMKNIPSTLSLPDLRKHEEFARLLAKEKLLPDQVVFCVGDSILEAEEEFSVTEILDKSIHITQKDKTAPNKGELLGGSGGADTERENKRVKSHIPNNISEVGKLAHAVDTGAVTLHTCLPTIIALRTRIQHIISTLDRSICTNFYNWSVDSLNLWPVVEELWQCMSCYPPLYLYFPDTFFWSASRKQLFQRLLFSVFLMQVALSTPAISAASILTNRVSRVICGIKNIGKTAICRGFSIIVNLLFPHVLGVYYDYSSINKPLPSELVAALHNIRTGSLQTYEAIQKTFAVIFVTDEAQDLYTTTAMLQPQGMAVVEEIAELSNSSLGLSIVTGSSSKLTSLIFKNQGRPTALEGYRDLNDSKHTKYNLLPLTEENEARAFYTLVVGSVVSDIELKKRQWISGGVYGAWRDAVPVLSLYDLTDMKNAVLSTLAGKVDEEDRAALSPFGLPTISLSDLVVIIGPSADNTIAEWCDTGFLYETLSTNNYALQKPQILRWFWDRTTNFSGEQRAALIPLSKPSRGHVAEDMFLEDYCKERKLTYSGRKIGADTSKAKNVVFLSSMKQDLRALSAEMWTLAGEHGIDAAEFRLNANSKLVAVRFLQVKFFLKSNLVVRDVRDAFRRDFQRWRSLFRENTIDVDWTRATMEVFHFGAISDNDIHELTKVLQINHHNYKADHEIFYHGSVEVFSILRTPAKQLFQDNISLYPFLEL